MMKIPVFDSSAIEIPTSKVKVHSYEAHPITAWARQGSRGTQRSHATSQDRPTSRTSTRGGPTPDLEAHRGSPKLKRGSPVSVRKWADARHDDRRSKTIVEMLETRRATKQSDNTSQITDSVNGASVQFSSPRMNEEVTNEKVITYPKFVVVHDSKEQTQMFDGKVLGGTSQETGQNAHLTNTEKKKESAQYHSKHSNNNQLRRNVEARRSYKSYKTSKAIMYDQSSFSVTGRKSGSTNDKSRSMENLYPQTPDDDFIMGLYPDDMQDYLQARAIITPVQRAVSKHSRGPSPGYQHQPPPPTPASALLMSFGIDPEDREILEEELRKEMTMESENRKNRRERMRNRDINAANIKRDGSDPGVSHTSHRLLEAKVIKHTFAFPEITSDMQRKATGKTPRVEDLMAYSHVNSRPKTIGGIAPSNRGSTEKLPTLEDSMEKSGSKDDLVNQGEDASYNTEKERPKMKRSKTTLGAEPMRSNTFVQNKDKYSKLVSLGLPKVTIDIERNHFSRDNILRRSTLLREKFEIKDFRKEHVDGLRRSFDPQLSGFQSFGETEPKTLKAISVDNTKDNTRVVRKMKLESKQDFLTPHSPRQEFMDTNKVLESVEKAQSNFSPRNTPSVTDEKQKRVKTPDPQAKKESSKSKTVLKTKVIVGVSHFQMSPPGKGENSKTNSTEAKQSFYS